MRPFVPTTTTSKMMFNTRQSFHQSLKQSVTKLTTQLMKLVPTEETNKTDETNVVTGISMMEDDFDA